MTNNKSNSGIDYLRIVNKNKDSIVEKRNLLIKVKKEFFKRLEEKTNWGRNQLKEVYNEILQDVLLEIIE